MPIFMLFAGFMELFDLKKKLLEACFHEVDQRAASLRRVMEEAQQSANEYGQPKDRYDSYRTQLLRKRDMFGQQLQKILEQRHILEKVNTEKRCPVVEFGALVDTGDQIVFVSVGLGRIEHDGKEYFVISPAVPFYIAMEGKSAGETFDFRGKSLRINQIA